MDLRGRNITSLSSNKSWTGLTMVSYNKLKELFRMIEGLFLSLTREGISHLQGFHLS